MEGRQDTPDLKPKKKKKENKAVNRGWTIKQEELLKNREK